MIKSLAYRFVCALVAALALSAFVPSADAQETSRDMQKEARIREELAAISPGSVEAFTQATELMDKEDMKQAVPLFREVLKKAPKLDVVNRRLGSSLVEVGEVEEGMALLRKAVELKRSPDNLISLARRMAYPGNGVQGSQADEHQALALAKEARRMNTDESDPSYAYLVASIALDLRDEQTFRDATRELVSRHPELMPTHYFNAIRAAMDEEWSTAEAEIRKAGEMGLPANVVEEFLASGIHTRVVAWRYAYLALAAVLVWAVGLGLLFIVGGILSKRTLSYLERADPNTLIDQEHEKLRSIYRKVINIAGLYYYVSIPVVIFLMLAVTGAVIYGFVMIGTDC